MSVWRIIPDCPFQPNLPNLPRQLKTHIAFSMFPILDRNLWYEAILLFWIHLPEEVWHVVMAKKGEIQNYCFDKESNISLQWCGCSFRVFLDYWCFEKVQSHSQLNKKGLSFKRTLTSARNIHIECSKQFKWKLYFYVSGQSWPFWTLLKLL